jgi:hypothetical protein
MATKARAPTGSLGRLVTVRIAAGTIWHHIFADRYSNPLGYGFTPSRFSDPRHVKHPFGVYYLGATVEVAFLETWIRDTRNYNPGVLRIAKSVLADFAHVAITVREDLDVVDLRGGNPIKMGIPTDAVRAQKHAFGQKLGLELYRHSGFVDGLCYPSRLNQDENVAVYDRAVHKLIAGPRRRLDQCPELAPVFDRYRIAFV